MKKQKTLKAFSEEEYKKAHSLLATKVAQMMGRKFEEGDWSFVYCNAKGILDEGWSNLNIDVICDGKGIEHKMLCVSSRPNIKEHCGTTLMHPSATRSIRIPLLETDPTKAARDVLKQYEDLINQRKRKVEERFPDCDSDMRYGWLLWQESLQEFLYFEEEMILPDPDDYYAEWKESGGGKRKKSKNLWVYENETGKKRYSITTAAGAKIQPYFDVPPPNDPNLNYFCVQGEVIDNDSVRIWITSNTAILLKGVLGNLEKESISEAIIKISEENEVKIKESPANKIINLPVATPIMLSKRAYDLLKSFFPGVSDENMVQNFLKAVSEKESNFWNSFMLI